MAISTRIKDVVFLDTLKQARAITPKGFAPEFAEIGRYFREQVREGFAQETDPYGNPWPALARSTIADKRARGISNPAGILKETGELANSFEYRVLVNGVRLFSNRIFDDGTDANIHQFGGIHPRGRNFIPRRQMLPESGEFPEEWLDAVERIVGDGIDRIFK